MQPDVKLRRKLVLCAAVLLLLFLCGCTKEYMEYYYYGIDATPTPTAALVRATPTPSESGRYIVTHSKSYIYTGTVSENVKRDVTMYFDIYSDNTASLVDVEDKDNLGKLEVPKTIENGTVMVTEIDDYAFYNVKSMKSISFPVTITSVGMKTLTETKWYQSSEDDYLVIGDGILIKSSAKASGGKLTLKVGIKYIKEDVFAGRKDIMQVILPDSLLEIGERAFQKCSYLCEINFPDHLKVIGDNAFFNCAFLAAITVPASVESINDGAFTKCLLLSSVTLTEGLRKIGESAFLECTNLKTVALPSSLEFIGAMAFQNSGLSSVTFGDYSQLVKIGALAFENTEWFNLLNRIEVKTLSQGYKYFIPSTKYYTCGKNNCILLKAPVSAYSADTLDQIQAPKGVTSVYSGAFTAKEIKVFVFADGITAIESLGETQAVRSVIIPKTVTEIKEDAFRNTSVQLLSFQEGSSLYRIGKNAFRDSDLYEISVPASVGVIDYGAFRGCTELNAVTLNTGLTEIGSYAFERCSGLVTLKLPKTLTKIGAYVFSGCTGLTGIIIPKAVTQVGNAAFNGCKALNKVVITGQNTVLSDDTTDNAFSGCTKELKLYIPENSVNINYLNKLNITYGYVQE